MASWCRAQPVWLCLVALINLISTLWLFMWGLGSSFMCHWCFTFNSVPDILGIFVFCHFLQIPFAYYRAARVNFLSTITIATSIFWANIFSNIPDTVLSISFNTHSYFRKQASLLFPFYGWESWHLDILCGGDGLVAKSCPTLVTPWTVAHQAPLSMGFSRQEYWSGLPCLSPGALPDPGIELRSPAL